MQRWRHLITLTSCFLSGCGFHLSTVNSLPQPLHSLVVKSTDSRFGSQLKSTLSGMGFSIGTSSRCTLKITSYVATSSLPTVVLAGQPTTATQSALASASLVCDKKTIAARSFTASQEITLSNTALTSSKPSSELIFSFNRDIIQQIYLWMQSKVVASQFK